VADAVATEVWLAEQVKVAAPVKAVRALLANGAWAADCSPGGLAG
jgi:hypothetical protein